MDEFNVGFTFPTQSFTSETPYYWIPDELVNECCNVTCKVPFTFFNRKHHCRSCGKIFCSKCSKNRSVLKQLGYMKPVRLCDICAKEVQLSNNFRSSIALSTALMKENDVVLEWMEMIKNRYDGPELERKVYIGVPDNLRHLVWCYLSSSYELAEKNPGVYEHFLLKAKANCPCNHLINADIPRTFPDHPNIQQLTDPLYNVLSAYSVYNHAFGYKQGMSFICAVLLFYTTEENAFWLLIFIMKKYKIQEIYDLCEESKYIDLFKTKFKKLLPDLEEHISRLGCPISIYPINWIKTLFSSDFSRIYTMARIWDIFFIEGIPFLINFSISLIFMRKDKILNEVHPHSLLPFIKDIPNQLEDEFDEVLEFALNLD